MIEHCIICHLKFVEQETLERFPQFCGNCMHKSGLEAKNEGPKPSITNSIDMLAALEQTFRESFGKR